jgi:hypothetical protein
MRRLTRRRLSLRTMPPSHTYQAPRLEKRRAAEPSANSASPAPANGSAPGGKPVLAVRGGAGGFVEVLVGGGVDVSVLGGGLDVVGGGVDVVGGGVVVGGGGSLKLQPLAKNSAPVVPSSKTKSRFNPGNTNVGSTSSYS